MRPISLADADEPTDLLVDVTAPSTSRVWLYAGIGVLGALLLALKWLLIDALGWSGATADGLAAIIVLLGGVAVTEAWFRIGPGAVMTAADRTRLRQLDGLVLQTDYPIMVTEICDGRPAWLRIVFANEAMTRLTGYPRSELIGQSPSLLQGPGTDRATLDRIRAAIAGRKRLVTEVLNYRKNGQAYWVQLDLCPVLDPDGGCTHYIALQSDVTARRLAQMELADARAAAETALVAQRTLLAVASHELRTPLHQLIGYFELLAGTLPEGSPAARDYAAPGLAAGRRLARQIDELLDVARQDLGAGGLTESDESLDALLGLAVRDVRRLADGRSIAIRVDGPALTVRLDLRRMRRVLVSLLIGAMERTPDGGSVTVTLGVEPEGAATITVRDGGLGLSRALASTLAGKACGIADVYKLGEGDGLLGLHLARLIAERHGGGLDLPDRNSVRLLLPAGRVLSGPAETASHAASAAASLW